MYVCLCVCICVHVRVYVCVYAYRCACVRVGMLKNVRHCASVIVWFPFVVTVQQVSTLTDFYNMPYRN